MKISYYFQPLQGLIGTENIPAVIDAHTRSFERLGWEVVGLDESVSRQHPLYSVFDDENSVFAQSRNGWNYTRACYMRWLAYAVAGHYFADFDVINYDFSPGDAADLRGEIGGPTFLSGAGAAGLFRGNDYDLILSAFLKYKENPVVEGALKEDVNDMTMLLHGLPHLFAPVWKDDVRLARDYSCDGWNVAKLVHYPFQYVKPPRIKTILEERSLGVIEPYQDLSRWLGEEIDRLKAHNDRLERDCDARLADVTALSDQVARLYTQIGAIDLDRAARLADVIKLSKEVETLSAQVQSVERDSAQRLTDIYTLTAEIEKLRRSDGGDEIKRLHEHVAAVERDSAQRLTDIYTLTAEIEKLRRSGGGDEIKRLHEHIAAVERDSAQRLTDIYTLTAEVEKLRKSDRGPKPNSPSIKTSGDLRVVIYANCQGGAVKKLLPLVLSSQDCMQIHNFENYKLIGGDGAYEDVCGAAAKADVFIYQPIGPSQGKFSTSDGVDNVMAHVRPGAQRISLAYVYNDGFWPMFDDGTVQNAGPVEAMFAAGANQHDVVAAFDRGDMFFDIKSRTQRCLDILRERESVTDVQVADFMEANRRSSHLMLVQAHPSTEVFVYAVRQIARLMFGNKVVLNDLELHVMGLNYADLPGMYPIDRYCIEEGGLTYVGRPDAQSGHYYHGLIHRHYRDWLARQQG